MAAVAGIAAATSELPRVLVALDALPDVLRPFVWSDLLATYAGRGLAGGHLPYFEVPFEYPPLMGYLAGLFAVTTSSAAAYLTCWAAVVTVTAAALGYVLSREAGPARALVYWALAPQLLIFAGLNVDVLPAALLVASAILARRHRESWAALALGLGTMAKLFPAAAAPLLALRGPRVVVIWTFTLSVGLLALPALLAPHSTLAGITYYAFGYEAGGVAVWGLLSTLLHGLGVPEAALIVLLGTTGGFAATYLALVVPRARRAGDPAVGFALATLAVLLWSRLYSPQFSLWVVPFFVLLPTLRARAFILLGTADLTVFLIASPLTLVRWDPTDMLPAVLLALLAAAVVLRHVALLFAWRDIARAPA